MKIADTISVNPSKTALGHVEAPATTIFRSPVLGTRQSSHNIDLLSMLFPVGKSGFGEYKKYEVPLRTLLSTILIVTGIVGLTATSVGYGIGFAICSICFGAFLAVGLFTRPLMIGAAIYYCITGALAIRSGLTDISVFSLMFGCLVFGVIGSGKYSCDSFIRSSITRHSKNRENKRKQNVMGYKAFHNVKY